MLINEWFDIGTVNCQRAGVKDYGQIKNKSEYECNVEVWIRF